MERASPKTFLCPYLQLQRGSCHPKGQRETLNHTPPVTENVRGRGGGRSGEELGMAKGR